MKKSILLITVLPAILFTSCSCSRFFYQPNKTVKDITIEQAVVTKTFVQNEKQREIALIQFIPTNRLDANITVLVVPPNGGNSSILSKLIEPLVNIGHVVYLFDYEGYGESEGKANNQNVLKDAQLILNHIVSNKENSAKLLLWGFSLGGNLAVKLTMDNPSKIDALIIEGAFTSHQDIAKDKLPKGLKWISKFIQSPYPSREVIKNLQIPILIAHSVDDEVCPFSMGKTLFENANQPKYFLQLTGKHCYGLLLETDKYIDTLQLFLNQNNIK